MQIINVFEVHRIGGLSHFCVVAEKQYRTHQALLSEMKVKASFENNVAFPRLLGKIQIQKWLP